MRLTSTGVLVLCVLAFAGSAYAADGNGNGNGKGNGNGEVAAAAASPGNSADAPGQMKKDEAPPATTTTTTAAAPETNATGVKPSNTTAHETHAEAQSDQTKQYGNGQTAGQIAEQNGAPGNTVLHGPGNSQPHKATRCSGGHEVDVHALKSHRSGSCGSGHRPPDPIPDPGPAPKPKPNDPPVVATTTTTTPKKEHGDPAAQQGAHGIAGDVESTRTRETRGVLSATQAIGHAATLPFTGQTLWAVVLAGLVLIATGVGLRRIRTAEARVESGHEHTDRIRHAAARSRRPVGGRSGR